MNPGKILDKLVCEDLAASCDHVLDVAMLAETSLRNCELRAHPEVKQSTANSYKLRTRKENYTKRPPSTRFATTRSVGPSPGPSKTKTTGQPYKCAICGRTNHTKDKCFFKNKTP
ncbi:hypothetical protein QE152_g26009 [Popillia japonica]|uniref:Gag protein n=1 Tax=Popillia japonica TaxID=7064 RepID=A0AAW1K036_POPJA